MGSISKNGLVPSALHMSPFSNIHLQELMHLLVLPSDLGNAVASLKNRPLFCFRHAGHICPDRMLGSQSLADPVARTC